MGLTWLAVEPLDTVMVRDGRAFDAGADASAAATATAPPPSTFGGVVRSAVGRDVRRIVGPVIDTPRGVVFPAPVDLVRDDDGVAWRLAVSERGAEVVWDLDDLDDQRRLSHALSGDGEPVPEWVTRRGLAEWLAADGEVRPGARLGADWVRGRLRRDPAWLVEPRLGLARRWDGPLAGTAEPSLLYTMSHLRPRDGVRFLVGCEDPGEVTVEEDVVRLGGRGRLAHVSAVTGGLPGPPLPPCPASFPGGRVSVYLATPTLLDDVLWQPPGAVLCAVALAGPQPVATASWRRGLADSRQLNWAVPAGSVYYLRFGSAEIAAEWAGEHHGGLLPGASGQPIATAGFGTCLTGRW
jgi:CRISPR-associated protein Cmr3